METVTQPDIIPAHRWTHTGDRVRFVRGEVAEHVRAEE